MIGILQSLINGEKNLRKYYVIKSRETGGKCYYKTVSDCSDCYKYREHPFLRYELPADLKWK